jgi:hypothetical protein
LVLKIWTKVSLHLEHIVLFVETQHNGVQHITSIQRIAEDAYVWMDPLPFATDFTIVTIKCGDLAWCDW